MNNYYQYPSNQQYTNNYSNSNMQQLPLSTINQQFRQQPNQNWSNNSSPSNNPQKFNSSASQQQYQNNTNPTRNIEVQNQDLQIRRNDDQPGDLYDTSRASFIRKVYCLVGLQLIITTLICAWAMNSTTFQNIFMNSVVCIALIVIYVAMMFVIGCCINVVRQHGLPILVVFTVVFALIVGIICVGTSPITVLTAAGITAVIVIGLTIFSCVTKSDFTGYGPFLFIFGMIVFIFGIGCIFWQNPIAQLVYSCLAALLFGVYLIYDTQMILGKFTFSYSLDDAYFAAIMLYIDIMEIFLQVLRILSLTRGNN